MYKRLLILNGLAIFAVVCNHSAGFGQIGLFLWADSFRAVVVPDWSQIGSFYHYFLIFVRQAATFCVPAFFFVSGFFICYAAKDKNTSLSWGFVRRRITTLVIPYLIWTAVLILVDILQGKAQSPLEYLVSIPTKGVIGPYWFVPALCYSYLISPIVVRLVQWNWKITLLLGGLIQVIPVAITVAGYWGLSTPLTDTLVNLSPIWSPFHWIFFFIFGISAGFHVEGFTRWLNKYRVVLSILVLFALIFNIAEADYLMRSTLEKWGAYELTFSFNLYAISFILWILSLIRSPFTKSLSQLSTRSYGIYLIHYPFIEFTARIIHKFLPRLLGISILFVPLLVFVGLGGALLIMSAVRKSPVKQYYRFLFA